MFALDNYHADVLATVLRLSICTQILQVSGKSKVFITILSPKKEGFTWMLVKIIHRVTASGRKILTRYAEANL